MIEALATFMFTLVYVNQVDEDTQFFPKKDKHMNFLFTSISFGIFVLIAYPISGGCLNPAIGFSICFVDLFKTGSGNEVKYVWIYLIFPLIGALLAIMVFECCYK